MRKSVAVAIGSMGDARPWAACACAVLAVPVPSPGCGGPYWAGNSPVDRQGGRFPPVWGRIGLGAGINRLLKPERKSHSTDC